MQICWMLDKLFESHITSGQAQNFTTKEVNTLLVIQARGYFESDNGKNMVFRVVIFIRFCLRCVYTMRMIEYVLDGKEILNKRTGEEKLVYKNTRIL